MQALMMRDELSGATAGVWQLFETAPSLYPARLIQPFLRRNLGLLALCVSLGVTIPKDRAHSLAEVQAA
jgi:hypothetical protein